MCCSSYIFVSLALALGVHAEILEVPTAFLTVMPTIISASIAVLIIATAMNTTTGSDPTSSAAPESPDGMPLIKADKIIRPIFIAVYLWRNYRLAKRQELSAAIREQQRQRRRQQNSGNIALVSFEYPLLEGVWTPPSAYQLPPSYAPYPSRPPSHATMAGAPAPSQIANISEERAAGPGTGNSPSTSDTRPSTTQSP